MKKYTAGDLYEQNKERLGLELLQGEAGLSARVRVPEAHRPGLSLAGYLKGHSARRILVFGQVEMSYLRDLKDSVRKARLKAILEFMPPAVIVGRNAKPLKELLELCQEEGIALFHSSLSTMTLLSKLTILLHEAFAPTTQCHGTLVEVFGVGVMITGESSVGKSEAALGLIERGHRLVTDDLIIIKRKEGDYLEGSGLEWSRHHMEIRGIGIINVANLYGAVCVRESKSIDVVVQIEVWDDAKFYDRVGVEDRMTELLGVNVPLSILPVRPGRDVVLLLETVALNHRLKQMGYHSAQEFTQKVRAMIQKKSSLPGVKRGRK